MNYNNKKKIYFTSGAWIRLNMKKMEYIKYMNAFINLQFIINFTI